MTPSSTTRNATPDASDSQSLLMLILYAAGEGIYGLDAEGRTTFANPAAVKMLGWTPEEILGRPMHDIHHHTKQDGSPYLREECPIYAAFKDGKVHYVDNEVFWCKDGSSIPVEYTSTPIREGDRLVGAVVVFRDITERKSAEQEKQRAFEEIARLKEELERERDYLREEVEVSLNFGEIVGESPVLKQRVLARIEAVASTPANVLILGESGVGKELVARAIHAQSDRKDKALVKVNCASIPRELFESEFFGHVKGSFTGAHRDRVGRFQLADGGTLFLDEIGEIPLELQGKLLRALQERAFERVGEDNTRHVDVRIIAATNRDLKTEVEADRFRQDLYYRLSVFPIEVPPLRERREDIIPLATHFLKLVCRDFGREAVELTQYQAEALRNYDWPGNIRELQNVIERTVILSQGNRLRLDLALPETVSKIANVSASASTAPASFVTAEEFKRRERIYADYERAVKWHDNPRNLNRLLAPRRRD